MPRKIAKATLREALTRERRKNKRLRALLDQIHDRLHQNAAALNVQVTRLGQLQAEVDALKIARR